MPLKENATLAKCHGTDRTAYFGRAVKADLDFQFQIRLVHFINIEKLFLFRQMHNLNVKSVSEIRHLSQL